MAIKSGVVEAMARSGKGMKIDGEWYSGFTAGVLNGAKVGDNVSFTYTETTKEGTTYKNIKGSVSISDGPTASEASAPARTAGGSTGGWSKGGRSFPVGPLDPERSIIRQNALTQANKMMENTGPESDDLAGWSEHALMVIAVARIFESYSAGDMDAAEAEKAVESLRSGMTRD